MKTMLKVWVASVCVLSFMQAVWAQTDCQLETAAWRHMESSRITLVNDEGKKIQLEARIADEPLERAGGYQYICADVILRTAILFRYNAPTAAQFHMNNVKAPLDIGFFDEHGVLTQSMVMYPYTDGNTRLYGPMQSFQYALEAPQGFFHEKKMSAGSTRLLLKRLP